MNHPKPEEWVSFVYGEAPSLARKELTDHLENCAQCRQEVETWKRSLKQLDSWKLPRANRPRSALQAPLLQWAAAAAVLLLVGIWIGRATAPAVDVDKLRVALLPQIRRDLQPETAALVRQEVTRAASLTLASSQTYADRVGQQVYVVLKKELDTVAVNAADGLRNTAEQLVQLADYDAPAAREPSR